MDKEAKERLAAISYKNEHGIPLTREEQLFAARILFGKEDAEFVANGSEVQLPPEQQGKGIIATK